MGSNRHICLVGQNEALMRVRNVWHFDGLTNRSFAKVADSILNQPFLPWDDDDDGGGISEWNWGHTDILGTEISAFYAQDQQGSFLFSLCLSLSGSRHTSYKITNHHQPGFNVAWVFSMAFVPVLSALASKAHMAFLQPLTEGLLSIIKVPWTSSLARQNADLFTFYQACSKRAIFKSQGEDSRREYSKTAEILGSLKSMFCMFLAHVPRRPTRWTTLVADSPTNWGLEKGNPVQHFGFRCSWPFVSHSPEDNWCNLSVNEEPNTKFKANIIVNMASLPANTPHGTVGESSLCSTSSQCPSEGTSTSLTDSSPPSLSG